MSNAVRGRGIIDLRKRRAGASVRAARARVRAESPLHRRTSLRVRRRKLRALMALAALVAAAGAVYGVSELSYLPRYAITEVQVEGTANVPPRLVQAFVETKLNDGAYSIISNENIFLYPKAAIAKSVSEYFPRILSADISRGSLLAQAITVSILEREPFALWCQEAGKRQEAIGNKKEGTGTAECFVMDESGFIFETAAATSTGAVVFTGGLADTAPIGQTFLPERLPGIRALLSRLEEQGFSATSVSVESEQDFAVSLAERFVLRASFGADAVALVRNLEAVLSSGPLLGKEDKIEYIDLRFGNRVYYKNRN